MAKKLNIDNPALQFLTPTEKQPTEIIKPLNRAESKSKRLQLLIKPSLHSLLKDKAEQEGTSVNNLINEILEKELRK